MSKVLRTSHNAGFFSCCSIRLHDIIDYFNRNKELPERVDSSAQFAHYKSNPKQDLTELYFRTDFEANNELLITYNEPVNITNTGLEPQFSPYKQLNLSAVLPFVERYFTESCHVGYDVVNLFIRKYKIDIENTCAVFYRGNDKVTETSIATYDEFINKAKEVQKANPGIRFLVQPDETNFLHAFLKEFPDAIYFEETPHIQKKDSCVFYEVPVKERAEYAAKFLAAVKVIAQCKHLITHSGNGAIWSIFFRGNAENVHQYLIDRWV